MRHSTGPNDVSAQAAEEAFRRILADHLRRYPQLARQDLYKLVHQAALGSEHAVSEVSEVSHMLNDEVARMGEGPEEPLVDPLSPDGMIVRVHLRPYLAAGLGLPALLEAFVRTAGEYRGTEDRLEAYWSYVEEMARAGRLSLARDSLASFFSRMRKDEFPAVHHSPEFEEAYRPAYRVILRELLPLEG